MAAFVRRCCCFDIPEDVFESVVFKCTSPDCETRVFAYLLPFNTLDCFRLLRLLCPQIQEISWQCLSTRSSRKSKFVYVLACKIKYEFWWIGFFNHRMDWSKQIWRSWRFTSLARLKNWTELENICFKKLAEIFIGRKMGTYSVISSREVCFPSRFIVLFRPPFTGLWLLEWKPWTNSYKLAIRKV